MKRNRNNTRLAGLLLLLALAAGCSKKEETPAPAGPATPQPAAPVVQPAPPVQKQLSSAVKAGTQLDFSKRTDPFKPYAATVAAPVVTGEQPIGRPTGDLLPIQSFEVTKFKVAGIIAGLQENRALLIDPNGKGYVVQVGMQIGSNGGRITRITSSSIEVVERFKESSGRIKSKTIVLTLAKKR